MRALTNAIGANLQVDQLSQSIQQQISQLASSQQPGKGKADFKGSLEDAFQSDDRLLASLQKLGWELEQPDPEEAVPVEKLKEVCMRCDLACPPE